MAETSRASLGFVTSYGAAKRGGYEGTYEEWCALMAEVADHLEQNESLYADTTTAKEAAEAAQGYAEVAQGKAEDAQTAAETAQGKAEDAEDAAEAWAAGTSGGTPSATNNASYYAGQASDSATASAASAASAEAWATGGSSGTSSATNNAKYYSDQAEDFAEAAEAWATGGFGGTASASNNAKYYSEQAATSATAAAAVGTNFAPTFSSSTAYSAGDYVMYNGTQYRFTANHAAGAWTGSDAEAEPISPVVADLKTQFEAEQNPITLTGWESGTFDTTNGNNYAQDTFIRNQTKMGLENGTSRIICDNGYKMLLFAWNTDGTYIGSLKADGTFTKVTSNFGPVTEFDCTKYPDYLVKVGLRNEPASSSITTGEGTHCHFYNMTDKTLSVENKAADAKVVGDELSKLQTQLTDFEDGTFDKTVSKNLYNPENKSNETYLRYYSGESVVDTNYITTDYIPVVEGKYLTLSILVNSVQSAFSDVPGFAFYREKSENSYISGSRYVSNPVVPANAKYARVCAGKNTTGLQIELTDNGVFTTPYEPYHKPTYSLKEDIDIPVEQITGDIASEINDISVKGSNLIPVSDNGIGKYIVSGGVITYQDVFTNHRYAIIDVKQNTNYFFNYSPTYWILADESNSPISYGEYPTRRYINTGNAEKLYLTFEVGYWNIGVIVSEGLTGMPDNMQQTSILKPLNQLAFDGWYACALPKTNIRFTVGINEKFYYKNILSLPDTNIVELTVSNFGTIAEDGISISIGSAGAFNNYLFTVYDNNLSIVEQNVNGQFGIRYADNVADCSALIIGDSTVERDSGKIGQTLLDAFTSREKTITLLGTRGTGDNKNEGRSGWSAADYVGKTTRGADPTQNPFYNQTAETFDFSYYMTNQGYESVDFVIIQLGINDLYNEPLSSAKSRINTLVADITTMINSIKTFNPDQKIILNLPTPCTAKTTGQYPMHTVLQKTIRAKFIYYNAIMEVLSTGFKDVRCSHCHLILDPETEIADLIHPTTAGLEKMGMEVFSQINAFQNA